MTYGDGGDGGVVEKKEETRHAGKARRAEGKYRSETAVLAMCAGLRLPQNSMGMPGRGRALFNSPWTQRAAHGLFFFSFCKSRRSSFGRARAHVCTYHTRARCTHATLANFPALACLLPSSLPLLPACLPIYPSSSAQSRFDIIVTPESELVISYSARKLRGAHFCQYVIMDVWKLGTLQSPRNLYASARESKGASIR